LPRQYILRVVNRAGALARLAHVAEGGKNPMAIASEFDEVLRDRTDDESGQICRRPSAVFSRPMLCRLLVSLAAPFALAITLLRASPCQAIPPGGPLPPPDCAGDVTGRLTATPPSFDREKDLNFDTTLTWSVTIPKGCPVGSFTLADSPVPRSGSELIQNVLFGENLCSRFDQ
jgi:hypothetical protein